MNKITAAITAIGSYVPEDKLTNAMLEQMVDTNDEWIYTRTGIKERRILKDPNKGSSFLAIQAANEVLRKRGIDAKEIDLLILATATPDMPVALTGPYVASEIGATNAYAFDLQAACCSFLFGISMAAKYIESGRYKKVLLVGADKMSSIIDYTDRATCIIFGDGAGAALFEPNYEGLGVQDEILKSDGVGRNYLYIKAGGSLCPTTVETAKNKEHFVFQDGKSVFKYAVTGMADVAEELLKRNGLDKDSLQWLTPHQANKRIIDATAERIGLAPEKVMMNIEKYGNTTSGTLILAMSDYEHLMKKGDNVIFTAFGGGFTWGAIYVKWAYDGK
ncbi:3-oxoacyl-[acyl-carrier-protein] synthase III [Capnocytophaga haemolytica]|jgi:3-oxoacyl-[acyl-carrier-protein] synthase 3|uniref:Beta-ketoacyl-[acyl-carrier-protein] synthase III n=1 Tax=Capnocytophaga haemolytica TaxID=45243 RepID=A0AAX2H0D9_9FLAO|nr:beta-ketoacyl-ACP synthase III [Capnocytophaga haemolytica]AMD84813.1 3-oxoacyl-ACP synthase [Capnocytophaga haemolytica]SFN75164.1 3-oxoacyl-[acyl-carrier-protein] synthase III [Capnocytophaga haemolytica]SNV07170.1 3-oxoacyl-[acyl-carrier-protein] synthase 3 [Capnocytophaga haemolytica]